MAAETMNQAFLEPRGTNVQPELLVSAVLHLMSHYTAHPDENAGCTKLASVIERHLKALADLPDLAPVLRATCCQLSEQWGNVVERAIQTPGKQNLFSHLIGSSRTN